MVEGDFKGETTTFHPAFRFCKGFAWRWWKVEAVYKYRLGGAIGYIKSSIIPILNLSSI
jgi:hypothetical protein